MAESPIGNLPPGIYGPPGQTVRPPPNKPGSVEPPPPPTPGSVGAFIRDLIELKPFKDSEMLRFELLQVWDDKNKCKVRQDNRLPFPEYIFSEIEQYVVKDFTMSMQIPTTGPDDSQNILR